MKVMNVSGVSAWRAGEGNILNVFGGTAGICSGNDPNVETCDSCQLTELSACNEKRIYEELKLTITFQIDSLEGSGPILVQTQEEGEVVEVVEKSPSNVGVSETASVTLEWGIICTDVIGLSDCDSANGRKTVYIGVDANGDNDLDESERGSVVFHVQSPNLEEEANETGVCGDHNEGGICQFKVLSGNKKVFLSNLVSSSGFPVFNGSRFTALRVFYSTEGFDEVFPVSPYQSFFISNDLSPLEMYIISDLKNDTPYFFRVAVVDESQNVAFFTSDESVRAACGSVGDICSVDCPHCAVPVEALGILEKDLNCFVATVLYGDSRHFVLRTLRTFKKELLQFDWGRKLVKLYYVWGSRASFWVNQYPEMKPILKNILWVASVGIWMYLFAPWAIFCLFILLISFIFWKLQKNTWKLQKNMSCIVFWAMLFFVFDIGVAEAAAKTALEHKVFKSVQVGWLSTAGLAGPSYSFEEVYEEKGLPLLFISYGEAFFDGAGLFLWELGSGLSSRSIYGIKKGTDLERSNEKILFFLFPHNISLVYRLQWTEDQLLVPYIKGGVTAFSFAELLQSSFDFKLAWSWSVHAVGGVVLNMKRWSPAKKELQNDYYSREFGLFAEYRYYHPLSKDFLFSEFSYSLGLSLRF